MDKELGLSSLTIPSRLFHGRGKKRDATAGEGYVDLGSSVIFVTNHYVVGMPRRNPRYVTHYHRLSFLWNIPKSTLRLVCCDPSIKLDSTCSVPRRLLSRSPLLPRLSMETCLSSYRRRRPPVLSPLSQMTLRTHSRSRWDHLVSSLS